ncbi:nuclear protein Es2-domain-containing protein [Cladorrhinum sp. PSN332]|nr:nuclear protein Es2-domain-containing protein [Cladorrhinum sp. PSN332]
MDGTSTKAQSTALVRKRTDTELMPPPPPAKRIKRPKRILDEDTYTDALSHIIARDFFPGLLESETQQEYLDALESKDEEWISSASRRLQQVMTPGRRRGLTTPLRQPFQSALGQTPVNFIGDTPASVASSAATGTSKQNAVDMSMSLAAFQAKYTSEDNESFYKLLDKQNQKKVEKYAWLWTGNKLPSKQQIKQKEIESKLLAQRGSKALLDDGFKRDRLAIVDKEAQERPAVPDHWKSKPHNELMFLPDSVEGVETVAERRERESRMGSKRVVYENTRVPDPNRKIITTAADEDGDNRSGRAGSPTLTEIRNAISGKRRPCDTETNASNTIAGAGGETPRVNGYAFVDDEEPEPAQVRWQRKSKAAVPIIDLGPGDATPNPFQLQEQRRREALHHRMVDKISQSKRTSARLGATGKVEQTPVPKFPSSPRVSGGGLTPAAQRLWGKIGNLLVDLAAVASASRSVATKHVALRARQVERYGQTSSIVRGVFEEDEKAKENEVEVKKEKASEVVKEEPRQSAPPSPPPVREDNVVEEVKAESQETLKPPPPTAKTEFKPAPWAGGSIALLKQGFVPPRKPPPPVIGRKSIGLGGVLPGVGDVSSLFKTSTGQSIILEALKEVKELQRDVNVGEDPKASAVEVVVEDTKEVGVEVETPAAEAVIEEPRKEVEGELEAPVVEAVVEKAKVVVEQAPAASSEETAVEKPKEPLQKAPSAPTEDVKKPLSQEDASIIADLTSTPISSGAPAYELRESRVPSSRIGRLWNYGGLAAGMFAGAIGEGLSRAVGGGGTGSVMLSAANMERLVAKLSRMRGAALKLGQMMSFQDAKMLPAPIQEVLQRVQDRADYMPAWQRDKVMKANLGEDWRDLFAEFEEKPIAAASIGQVHKAVLKSTGEHVAVKIQFPGVADSINSDLDNIAILLAATKLLPKGLYLNKTIDNARTELAWECDYEREAVCAQRYREMLESSDDVFSVPRMYPEACGKHVLTMQFMDGVGVTRIKDFTQDQKDWIGTQILRLCLREITEFRFMQTDPNWTNFLYNAKDNKLELLDFGASREYPEGFIGLYIRLLEASSRKDRDAVKALSEELGYLTGHESKAMLDAHCSSVMTLAEPFLESAPEVYDFRDQTITERVKAQIPVMIHERLAPPPEETYSLHRKLSGAFLLCARLGSRVRCRELFEEALSKSGFQK